MPVTLRSFPAGLAGVCSAALTYVNPARAAVNILVGVPESAYYTRRYAASVADPGAGLRAVLALFWPRTPAGPGAAPAGVAASGLPAGPVLVVTPFADLGEGPEAALYAAGLGEELLNQLTPFKELTVLGRETSRSLRPEDGTTHLRGLGAGYALEGGIRVAGARVRATTRLVEVRTGSVLWSGTYDADLQS